MRTPRLRLLSVLLAVVLFFTLLPVSALAEVGGSTGVSHAASRSLNTDNKDNQGLTYILYMDHTATVANYDNSTPDGVIDIPDTVTKDNIDYTVTAIGDSAFESFPTPTNVSSVFIPATVRSIGDSAFSYCNALTTVTFAEGSQLKSIGLAAFYGTEQAYPRFKEIQIPDSVDTIGSGAFFYCQDLERITLPSALQTLSSVTFYGCAALSEVTFPASLKTIESSVFDGCRNLSEVKLPASLTAIQSSVFHRCSAKTVFYDGSLEQWNHITADNDVLGSSCPSLVMDDYTAQFIPVEYDPDDPFPDPPPKTVTITKYTGTESTVILPSTISSWPVTKIGEDAFQDNTTITSVTIPASVTEIGKLTAPTVEGYTFDGWYTNDTHTTEFDFTKPITGDTTIYAKWTANDYYVSFVTEHGDPPTSQNVKYNGTAADPGKLTEEGYTFIGWYTDHTCTTEFKFSTPITGDTKVYAKWEKNAPVLPDTYALNVSGAFVYVDGVDVTASAGDTSLPLEKDASVRLVADPDRMPSGMVFDRWTILNGALNADDAEKFETGRTLEEFAFTMPAEPLSIEATPRMQEEEGSDTVSVIAGVTLGTAATALVAWQAYDLGMSLYQEHWLPADFVMPKTRAELALLLWNTAGRPAPAAQPAFTDITDPDTAQAAQWAVETGLMTPKSADLFKPEKSVTRWKAVRSWKRVTNQNP